MAIPSRLRLPRRPIGRLAMTLELSHFEIRYESLFAQGAKPTILPVEEVLRRVGWRRLGVKTA